MKKRILSTCMIVTLLMGILAGCNGVQEDKKVKLDPDNPVSLTVWHYYNGARQTTFDTLIDEFNSTVGRENGIYVEAYSLGSVSELESAVSDAMAGKVGAKDLPDIFSSYADTAYSVQKQDNLVDLTQYFTQDELNEYVDSYIGEGYLNNDGKLYLFPTAKSTEIMMLNKTAWEPFAKATGTDVSELSTTEGIVRVAQRYYEWTDKLTPDVEGDGKAFYGRDSMSNYFVIGMKQMGKEIFEVKNGQLILNTDREMIHRLWENYYVPYIKGYFTACGKFRSDDVKTGDIIAYTGSTSSVMYFPDMVENDEESYDIDYLVLDAPVMEGGSDYHVQQGAGMAVTKSDKEHEYASCVFLRWLTQLEPNLRFVCDSGYMPVLKEANTIGAMDRIIKENDLEINQKTYDCLKCVMSDFENTKFYTTKCFPNGYKVRGILDYSLSDRAAQDKAAIDTAVSDGAIREEMIEKYVSEDSFEDWYEAFCNALTEEADKE